MPSLRWVNFTISDYNNYPARNPAPPPSNLQPTAPPVYQAPFDYSKYNGPVCFPGGQPFNPSQSQPQPQQQPTASGSGGPTTFTYTSGTPSTEASLGTLQPGQSAQGQQQPSSTQVGQLMQIPGQSLTYVVVGVSSDGSLCVAPTQ